MTRRIVIAVCLCLSLALSAKDVRLYAHRGAWSKDADRQFVIPENSLTAVREAARLGYEGIECDVRYTKDGKMVIMHDKTINRTMRRASDYSALTEPVYIADLTFDQLRNDYVLASTVPEYRQPVPTLEEILRECRRCRLVPMLHSSITESYDLAQKIMRNRWICFASKLSSLEYARRISDCLILWSVSKGTPEEMIVKLERLGGRCGISSMKYGLYSPEFIKTLQKAGYCVQCSIFPAAEELEALENGVDFVLTDRIRPRKKNK